MAKYQKNCPIEVSSSPEPELIQTRPRAKPNPAIPVIELSDDDDDHPVPSRVCPKPAPIPVAGPSQRRKPQKLGSSSSVQNIPKNPSSSRAVPLFLSSDEENDPPTVHRSYKPVPAPFPFQPDVEVERPPTPPQPANDPAPVVDLVNEPDPHSIITAHVLEIIPDVEPDYLLSTVTKHMLDHPGQNTATVIELILHALFEDNKYPKVDRMAKGKRKQVDEEEAPEGSPSKKSKIDYADKDRPFKGGQHYADLALEHLQTAFPLIPKTHLRQTLIIHNGLYAPAHLFLIEQEKSHEQQREAGERVRLPYTKRSTLYRPKGKGTAAQDEELEMEHKWLLEHLQSDGKTVEEGAEDDEDDGACDDGIECGCCFATYRFDKMIQCPEAHLFCMTCMRSYASTLLGTHDPNIKCMDQSGCKALIPPSELKRFLSEKLMTLYERVKQRKEIEAASLEGLEECPFCEWGCVIENPEEKLLRCGNVEACGAVSCRQCKKLDHLPKSCKEMDADKHLDGRHAVEEAMTQALMRNCPKCQKPFIKESGCNKMTCPHCMTLSCYICRQIIRGYDHFNPEPGRAASSNNPNAGKCLLWDSVEQRHADEVKAAAERAQAEYRRDNPDVEDDAIKVDLPVAPPPPTHGPGAQHAQHAHAVREAQVAVERAQAEVAAREAEERAHVEAMNELQAEMQYLEQVRHVPGMQAEYERDIAAKRAAYSRESTAWYLTRAMVHQAQMRAGQAQVALQNAQNAQAFGVGHHGHGYGYGAGYGYRMGMGGLNVNPNLYGRAGMAPPAPPPPVRRVPVAVPRAPRRRR